MGVIEIRRKRTVIATALVLAVAAPVVAMLTHGDGETMAAARRAPVLATTHVADSNATIASSHSLFVRGAPDEVSMLLVGSALIGLGAVLRRAA